MVVTSYSEARANLASLMDKATEDAEEIRITRRGKPDVVLITAAELEGLRETAYLLRVPANAERLLTALRDVREGQNVEALDLNALKREVGLAG
ncbi:MAG: type II toxin-antitoxin system prevent-host-death family antitoxin [Chloroflexota bacterium]|nr:type II toxin-antitoxin system prevent-host-death family antitoxin [Chloroflexota bacterium]